MKVKKIVFKGNLEVVGVYNFNRTGKWDGNNNHKFAKQDKNGIDYTSSRCLRHEMFKDAIPMQPSTEDARNKFVKFASSEVGILRGYLNAGDELKRASPLHVADAYTISASGQSLVFFDQGSSSKPKEANQKNKKGEDASDVSMFSVDNAPPRKQLFEAILNLKELQFLSLDRNYNPMVNANQEEEFLKGVSTTFNEMGADSAVKKSEFTEISSLYETKREGVLLNDSQLRSLCGRTLGRILSIDGVKTSSRLKIDRSSLMVEISDNIEKREYSVSDFRLALKDLQFHFFYSESN